MAYSSEADGARPSEAAVQRAQRAAQDGLTRQTFLRRSAGGVIGITSLAAFLSACGSDSGSGGGTSTAAGTAGSPPAQPTGTLRVAIANYLDTFDYTLAGSLAELTYGPNVFESLVQFNLDDSQLVPALATDWQANGDATEWTFSLRDGVTFHDGTPFDAAAVKRNFEYMTRRTAPYSFLIGAPRISTPDTRTVVLTYAQPFPDLAHNLTFACGFSSPKLLAGDLEAAARRLAKEHVGTGPFRYGGTEPGQSVTLTAYDGYWGDRRAHIETIKLVVIPEESARVSALQAGDVDLVLQVAPLAARSLKGDSRLQVLEKDSWTTVCLMPVGDQEPWTDVRVRQAMAYAVDRKSLVENVLLRSAVLDDSMFPPGIPGYHVPATTYAFDPDRARQLLREAGYSGQAIRLSTRADAVLASEITQAIVGQLKDVGFNVTGEVLDTPVYEADCARPAPRYSLHWNEFGWVTGGPFHMALGSIAGRSHYADRRYVDLVARVNSTADGAAREQLIAQAIDQWAADAGWIVLWVPKRIDSGITALQGYQPPSNVLTLFGGAYLNGAS